MLDQPADCVLDPVSDDFYVVSLHELLFFSLVINSICIGYLD